jgi:hypothetical protein
MNEFEETKSKIIENGISEKIRLQTEIGGLKEKFGQLKEAFENRPARPEDLKEIEESKKEISQLKNSTNCRNAFFPNSSRNDDLCSIAHS